MVRILVTGCHGLLGQKLVETFSPDDCDLYGIDVHPDNWFEGRVHYHYLPLDISRRADVLSCIRDVQPRVIINTAAVTSSEVCEVQRERCWEVNVRGVENLVDAARRAGARFIQLSSAEVFDGEAGPYSELDRVNPLSYYGKSKLAAENAVLGGGVNGAVTRSAMLFGHGRRLKTGFIPWLVGRLRIGKEVKIVTDRITNVTLVDDLAKAVRRLVTLNRAGIYHVASRDVVSLYEFAVRVADLYSLNHSAIIPTLSRLLEKRAPRPLQGGLIVDKAQRDLNLTFSTVDEALRIYRQQEASFN